MQPSEHIVGGLDHGRDGRSARKSRAIAPDPTPAATGREDRPRSPFVVEGPVGTDNLSYLPLVQGARVATIET